MNGKAYFFCEVFCFAITTTVFCLPPVFAHSTGTEQMQTALFSQWTYLIATLQIAICAGLSYRITKRITSHHTIDLQKTAVYSVSALVLLFCSAYFFSRFLPSDQPTPKIMFASPFCYIQAATAIILFAAREEFLYRQYIICSATSLTIPYPVAAISSTVLFAAAHIPTGYVSAANAFVCGCILLVCRKYTGSIVAVICVHSAYNLITFFLGQT